GNLGSPTLRPERAWSYEGGMDWTPSNILRGEVTFFERRERDGIDYYRASLTDIYRALNIQNLNFRGVEAALRWTPSVTHMVDLRFTELHGTQDTVAAGFTKYTFNYPKKTGVFAWQATPRGNFIFRTRVGVVQRYAQSWYPLWELYAGLPHKSFHP